MAGTGGGDLMIKIALDISEHPAYFKALRSKFQPGASPFNEQRGFLALKTACACAVVLWVNDRPRNLTRHRALTTNKDCSICLGKGIYPVPLEELQ
jgi:hypothetical protein